MKTFIIGLLITFGAAGGVEQSETDLQVMYSIAVAALGLVLMYIGTNLIKD